MSRITEIPQMRSPTLASASGFCTLKSVDTHHYPAVNAYLRRILCHMQSSNICIYVGEDLREVHRVQGSQVAEHSELDFWQGGHGWLSRLLSLRVIGDVTVMKEGLRLVVNGHSELSVYRRHCEATETERQTSRRLIYENIYCANDGLWSRSQM